MELLTTTSDEIISFFNTAKIISEELKNLQKYYRPLLNGEHYLVGEEVCKLLHISSRTLQYYRDDKLIPYIQIEGKILYKESDIIELLESNYQ